MRNYLMFFLVYCLCNCLQAQEAAATPPIIFIYDASGSMWGQLEGQTKKEIATKVLSQSLMNLPQDQQVSLVAYGHRRKSDCKDVEFLVDIMNTEKAKVVNSLEGITPLGKTPLAYSASQVIDKLRTTKMKATIILITDGIESCGGNICDVIKAAKAAGIDFRLHIVGFGLKDNETEQLRCAANEGDGQYYHADGAEGLRDVLTDATTSTVDEPTKNFSVLAVKNGKPVDASVKAIKAGTEEGIGFTRTYRDTGFMYLPPGKYDLVVAPLENTDIQPVTISGLVVSNGQPGHQTVSFDSGKIGVFTKNNDQGWDAVVNIYPTGQAKSTAGSRTYGKPIEFELNPGTYDVEMKILKIKGLDIVHKVEKVEVTANEITPIEHTFSSGIASIGAKSGAELVDATVNFREVSTKTRVDGSRTYTSSSTNPKSFLLNPGTYEVTLKALGAHKGKQEVFTVIVKQGETVEKIVNF